MPADTKTQEMVDKIYADYGDLIVGNEDHMSIVFSLLSLKVLNSSNKPDISANNKKLILENYPSATLEDIKSRGLDEKGLSTLLIVLNQVLSIAIDYSPLTNAKADQDKDFSTGQQPRAQEIATNAHASIKELGYSSFGSATTMVYSALMMATIDGVTQFHLYRMIIEAMAQIPKFHHELTPRKAPSDSEMINVLCKQMGISKATAKKYLASFKQSIEK